MRNIFKLVLIVFAFAMSLLVVSSSLQSESFSQYFYTKSVKQDNIILVSNNKINSEISLRKKSQSTNSFGSTPIFVYDFSFNNCANRDNPSFPIWVVFFISNTFLKGLYIRAP